MDAELLINIEAVKEIDLKRTSVTNLDYFIHKINNIIKANSDVRLDLNTNIYPILYEKLQHLLCETEKNIDTKKNTTNDLWYSSSLIINCLKNSAAICKKELCENEKLICKYLKNYITKQIDHSTDFANEFDKDEINRFNFYLFSLQYIFNLMAG
jgi:hypothetical protein